jgi:hypothetical protein
MKALGNSRIQRPGSSLDFARLGLLVLSLLLKQLFIRSILAAVILNTFFSDVRSMEIERHHEA